VRVEKDLHKEMHITNNKNLTIMRTKVLSLLLAFLAFNNVTFGQGELLNDEQSDLFYLSSKFCVDNIKSYPIITLSDIVEQNRLPINYSLYLFSKDTKEVTVGVLATSEKKNLILAENFPNNYTWVFVWKDFVDVCKEKDIRLDVNSYYLRIKTDVSSIRLAHLLGIRNTSDGLWLCTFTVNVKDLFRPAYETSVYKPVRKSKAYRFNISADLSENDKKWLQNTWCNNAYPWTRLGYTFDCGYIYSTLYKSNYATIDLENAIGVSEFILRPKSKIKDVKVYSIITPSNRMLRNLKDIDSIESDSVAPDMSSSVAPDIP